MRREKAIMAMLKCMYHLKMYESYKKRAFKKIMVEEYRNPEASKRFYTPINTQMLIDAGVSFEDSDYVVSNLIYSGIEISLHGEPDSAYSSVLKEFKNTIANY
jgi:hypothetical protein